MKQSQRLCLAAVLPLVVVAAARADAVNGGSWQTWSASMLGTNTNPTYGGAYWNNDSGDGATANVGWCLIGGGQCVSAITPGAIPYVANGSGTNNAPLDLSFTNNTASGEIVTLLLQGINTDQTGANGYDVLGWYSGTGTTNPSDLHALFTSNATMTGPSSSTVAPGASYGFYIENIQGAGSAYETDYYFLMNSAGDFTLFDGTADSNNDGLQHFVIFDPNYGSADDGSSYLIGTVDTNACFDGNTSACIPTSDFDFNDMLVTTSYAPDPAGEPLSFALSGGGLLLMAGLLGSSRMRRRAF